MAVRPYMKLWIADYLGDTQHLSAEQHGAYLLLLMTMWRAQGSLPNDPVKLARIARVTGRKWKAISPEIMDLFDVEDGKVTQKRLVKELREATDKSNTAKQNASARWLKNNEPPDADAEQAQCGGNAKADAYHSHSQLVPNGTNKNSRAKRGHVLPGDWTPTDEDRDWANAKGYSREFQGAQTEAMRNWAAANSNRAIARKADWSKAWRNWLDREWPKWSRRGTGPPQTRTREAGIRLMQRHGVFDGSDGRQSDGGEIGDGVRGELPKPAT